MIRRFRKVTDNLYRGSAPNIEDVKKLHKLGVRKIISLDELAGLSIDRICKDLGIEHIIIPLDIFNPISLVYLLKYNLKNLFKKHGPVFIHCAQGKDRTGFLIALYRIKFQNWDYKKALNEARHLGFGFLIDPGPIAFFERFLKKCDKNHLHDDYDSNDLYDMSFSSNKEYPYGSWGNSNSWGSLLGPYLTFPYGRSDENQDTQFSNRQSYMEDKDLRLVEKIKDEKCKLCDKKDCKCFSKKFPLSGQNTRQSYQYGFSPVQNVSGFMPVDWDEIGIKFEN